MRQRMPTGRSIVAVAVGLLLLVPSLAQAARDDKAKTKEKAARKACLAGDVVKGVGLLADLFVDTGNPTYVYNQARCYEQNHRYEDAISRYREFLKVNPTLTEQDRAGVQKEIAECQKLLPPVAPAPEAPPPPVPVPAAPVPEVVAPSPVVEPPPVTAPAPRADSGGLRIAGIVTGAVGIASIGVGVYFYTRARTLSDRITNADDPKGSDYRAGKRAETMQRVFYGVGAAALVTGSILTTLGWPSSPSNQTAVAPIIGPSMAGIAAKGAF